MPIDAQTKIQLEEELLEIVMNESMMKPAEISRSAELQALNIKSADFILILMAIEEKYGAYISVDNDFSEIKTVQDLLDLAVAKIDEHKQGTAA